MQFVGLRTMQEAVLALPSDVHREILVKLAEDIPDVATVVLQTYENLRTPESERTIKFDSLSARICCCLHPRKSWSPCPEHRDQLAKAARDETIETITQDIEGQIQPSSSFKTKRNALNALQKIGFYICWMNGFLRVEVQKEFKGRSPLDSAMINILRGMSAKQRAKMVGETRFNFRRQLEDLQRDAERRGLFDGIGRVGLFIGSS